jgi:hypothetical protein
MMKNKISMTPEQFNKLSDLLGKTHKFVQNAAMAAGPVYKVMSKNPIARALTCKVTSDLGEAWDTFFEINELLQSVKDTYMNELNDENINKGKTENE